MSRPGLGRNHSIGPLSEITPSHTPGTWTPKSIATRSFENLVAFAKDQELRREAKKLVWRDKGENPAELTTIEECFNHAWTGGKREYQCHKNSTRKIDDRGSQHRRWNACLWDKSRSKFVSFAVQDHSYSKLKFTLIRHAIFGSDSFRFAAMMGTFVAVYKFFINALPLIPNNKLPEILRYTPPAAQSEFDPHSSEEPLYMKRREEKRPEVEVADKKPPSRDVFVRKPVARWHAVVAGALAGLAVAFETPDRRLTIAQQIFVRNPIHPEIPLTPVYALQLRIQRASKVPTACVRMNHDLTRTGKFNIEDIKELISWEKTTPANKDRLMARLEAATKGHFGPHFAPCHYSEAVHPFFDSCKSVPLDRFIAVSSWMVPIYGALHFIPMILFKQSEFMKQPLKMLKRSAYGTARSSAFLGVFVHTSVSNTIYISPHASDTSHITFVLPLFPGPLGGLEGSSQDCPFLSKTNVAEENWRCMCFPAGLRVHGAL
ncbi:hypothetical protein AG1IA_00624 [Rhizoctonia solani AG-1 IA]|uniref:Uncharacterized protein n=1 Tax=Thanatephorus cucumeris (strain AG1-IA) TaxID=983506 RepID=L8X4X1_THACA|nr:hypothetical protein AG1IA_00624 [Rhizoctonia solani AG-1 IA]